MLGLSLSRGTYKVYNSFTSLLFESCLIFLPVSQRKFTGKHLRDVITKSILRLGSLRIEPHQRYSHQFQLFKSNLYLFVHTCTRTPYLKFILILYSLFLLFFHFQTISSVMFWKYCKKCKFWGMQGIKYNSSKLLNIFIILPFRCPVLHLGCSSRMWTKILDNVRNPLNDVIPDSVFRRSNSVFVR